MEINKSSWHYQFLRENGPFQISNSICGYVWSIPFVFTVMVMLGTMIGGLAIFALHPWLTLLYSLLVWDFVWFWNDVTIISLGIQIILLGTWGIISLIDYIKYKKIWRDQDKPPGILRTYWQAHKEQFCPTITFKD